MNCKFMAGSSRIRLLDLGNGFERLAGIGPNGAAKTMGQSQIRVE